jgi:ABC-type nitrate/sulfonate/bicarbonate transport system substrate-binding protein
LQAAVSAQARVLVDLRDHPDPAARVHSGTPRPITVDATLLRHHPEVVERFLSRVLAVDAWARQRPRETGIYLARESRCHEGTVRLAYGDDVHARMTTSLAPGAVQALKDQLAFLCAWGHVTQSFDVDAWIDPQPLQRAQARLAAGLLTVE